MSDEAQLDSADRRKLAPVPHQEREWTDIGTAEVRLDMFGRASVHVTHKQSRAHPGARIAIICALLIALVLLVYVLSRDEGDDALAPQSARQEHAAPPVADDLPVSAVPAVVMAVPPAAKHVAQEPPRADAVYRSATSAVAAAPQLKPRSKPKAVAVTGSDAQAPSAEMSSPIQPAVIPEKAVGDITY